MEFYLVLSVDQDVPQSLLATLLGASVIMILFGFLGETGRIPKTVGFGVGAGLSRALFCSTYWKMCIKY